MDLAQMETKFKEAKPEKVVPKEAELLDPTDADQPDEWDLALNFMKRASYMLGYFSSKDLSGPITKLDRERMGLLAGEIMSYVCQYDTPESEL